MDKRQPPRFGEKQDDEVSFWAFLVIHRMMDIPRLAMELKKLDGFVGVHPHMPEGTLAIFRTKNDAIRGKNTLHGFRTSGVGEVYIKKEHLNGLGMQGTGNN